MVRGLKVTLWIFVSFALALLIFVSLFDWNMLRGFVERKTYENTGRTLSIKGDLDVDLGLVPRVRVEKVRFANAEWSADPVMVDVEAVEFTIRLGDLVRGVITLPEVALTGPNVILEIDGDGRRNWELEKFKNAQPDDKGSQRSGPAVQRLLIDRGNLTYRDAEADTDLTVQVANTDRDGVPNLELIAAGKFRSMPTQARGQGGGVLRMQDAQNPYPLDLSAQLGHTRVSMAGTITNLAGVDAMDVKLNLQGQSLADLFPLFGVSLPQSPPYRIAGNLVHEGTTWRLADFKGKYGDSDIAGQFSADTSQERPRISAEIISEALDIDDLAGLIGAPPSAEPGEAVSPEQAKQAQARAQNPKIIPDKPLKVENLHRVDADVRLKARRIRHEGLPLDDLDAHMRLENGQLSFKPLNFGVAEGNVVANLDLAATQPPQLKANIELRNLNLGKLLPKLAGSDDTFGKVGGRAEVSGKGNSIGEILSSSNGALGLAMSGGTISNLLLEVIGLDIAEITKFLLAGDEKVPLRCAVAQFELAKGVLRTDRFIVDTEDTNIYLAGTLDFGSEALDLTLTPKPKDVSIFSGRTPLEVRGTLKQPEFEAHKAPLAARVGAAAVGAAINPALALIPFIETGPGENRDCVNLVKQAQEFGVPPDSHR